MVVETPRPLDPASDSENSSIAGPSKWMGCDSRVGMYPPSKRRRSRMYFNSSLSSDGLYNHPSFAASSGMGISKRERNADNAASARFFSEWVALRASAEPRP